MGQSRKKNLRQRKSSFWDCKLYNLSGPRAPLLFYLFAKVYLYKHIRRLSHSIYNFRKEHLRDVRFDPHVPIYVTFN